MIGLMCVITTVFAICWAPLMVSFFLISSKIRDAEHDKDEGALKRSHFPCIHKSLFNMCRVTY
jgi:hypothetical protein